MKGIVLNFSRKIKLPRLKKTKLNIRTFFSKNGIQVFFLLLFLIGLVLGASYSHSADKSFLERLDFLFVTNLGARMEMSSFEIFTSCFAADFLFICAVFLMGFSVWGSAGLPFVTALKGFSVGISSASVFSLYRAYGIGFYILVLLPGTVMFLLVLIYYAKESFALSLRYIRLTVFKNADQPLLGASVRNFLIKSLTALMLCAASALLDMLLWILFAHMFEF